MSHYNCRIDKTFDPTLFNMFNGQPDELAYIRCCPVCWGDGSLPLHPGFSPHLKFYLRACPKCGGEGYAADSLVWWTA